MKFLFLLTVWGSSASWQEGAVNVIMPFDTWEEGALAEELPPSEWPVGTTAWQFLDCWLMWAGGTLCGQHHLWAGSRMRAWEEASKHPSSVISVSASAYSFPPWLSLVMDCGLGVVRQNKSVHHQVGPCFITTIEMKLIQHRSTR